MLHLSICYLPCLFSGPGGTRGPIQSLIYISFYWPFPRDERPWQTAGGGGGKKGTRDQTMEGSSRSHTSHDGYTGLGFLSRIKQTFYNFLKMKYIHHRLNTQRLKNRTGPFHLLRQRQSASNEDKNPCRGVRTLRFLKNITKRGKLQMKDRIPGIQRFHKSYLLLQW